MKFALRYTTTAFVISIIALMVGLGCSSERAVQPTSTEVDLTAAKIAAEELSVFDSAMLEKVTASSHLDLLGRRAMGIDNEGTVHALYQRGVSAEQGLYFVSKPRGGEWSEPEVIGAPGTYPGTGWLEVREETGEAYVVFFQSGQLMLGIRRTTGWEFNPIEVPREFGVCKAAMTIDDAGRAHIALLVNWDNPTQPWLEWQIAYGYFDGSSDFHFQLLVDSFDPHHGLFSQPDIIVRPGGAVAIAYHHNADGQFLIRVEENDGLGGTNWTFEHVDVKGYIVYPETLEIDAYGYLHLAFHVNVELGAEHYVYHAVRREDNFGRAEEIGGDYAGARPRMAFHPDGEPHFVFEETLGAAATGRIIHAYREKGKWVHEVLADKEAFTPSFVIDAGGNGSILFERRITPWENHNIKYFGSVSPL